MAHWQFSKPRVPLRALLISVGALAVPLLVSQLPIDPATSVMIWLIALIPAFLLAYYRGWQGTATALAAAMATLALSNAVLLMRGGTINQALLPGLIIGIVTLCLG